ncbi:MAG: divergent polysaccharide deacetylase family protein [Alphaproteobacteria bacterium]
MASVTQNRPNVTNPRIAIVIDDLGIDQKRTRNAIALKAPLTMAFLPYGYNLRVLTKDALSAGHELIVHLPMQPIAADANPGPNALLHHLDEDEIRSRLAWNLSQFDGFVGINNHMGSDFTTWDEGMSVVLGEIKARGLFYLDSLTSPNSVAKAVGRREGLSIMVRDVFLDNVPDEARILAQLLELEKISRRRGYAIGIGHPYDATVAALSEWLRTLPDKGMVLVPLSKVRGR